VILQVGRFPWGEDPLDWLRGIALAAADAGFAGIALMDHLIQIPQVGRAWDPIPEPWVTLGALAALGTDLELGTLCTPATFRAPGIIAKAAATLDVLTGGRAFCGLGAGWWGREHAAYGLPFPATAPRLDDLAVAAETLRALWAPGTKAYDGERVTLPETTCYPRPIGPLPLIVGGGGERRTLRIAARWADACNVRADLDTVRHKAAVLRRHCDDVGRPHDQVAVTVLDVAVVGSSREDTWSRVERLRGRTKATDFASRHHAGEVTAHRERHERLFDAGVGTVFLALPRPRLCRRRGAGGGAGPAVTRSLARGRSSSADLVVRRVVAADLACPREVAAQVAGERRQRPPRRGPAGPRCRAGRAAGRPTTPCRCRSRDRW
jgi:alkanesulfonate monooxygenase SsuD/methylene tetrahydromethanopterin reductase-like flavin-dependent oxidoreductase (luciferase family)